MCVWVGDERGKHQPLNIGRLQVMPDRIVVSRLGFAARLLSSGRAARAEQSGAGCVSVVGTCVYVCVCMCVCMYSGSMCVCVCMCVCMYVFGEYVCVCVYVYVCVCVCVREREREQRWQSS